MLKALVTAEVIKDKLEQFNNIEFEYSGYNIDHEVMDRNLLSTKLENKDILICEYDTIDEEILKNAKNLKLIICCRGGYKSVIDVDKVNEMNIIVCNTAGRNANAVADIVIGYILTMTRNIVQTNTLIHDRIITQDMSTKPDEYKDTVWGLNNESPFIKYRGKSVNYMTLGLVGMGSVGEKVSKKASVFGMNVLAYDPYKKQEDCLDNVHLVSFDELINESDIISLHCPVTKDNIKLFNKDIFSKMKENSYFINTARGALVNENDLVDYLNNNHLSGAALDVTEVEPISSDSNLLNAKNLILTPHIAGSSYDVQMEGTTMIVQCLTDWINNKKPYNCVIEGNRQKCLKI